MKKLKNYALLGLVSTQLFTTSVVSAVDTNVYDAQNSGCVSPDANTSDSGGGEETNPGEINHENVKKIYNFLHDKYGFSGETIAGILGNWQIESSINPKSCEGIYGRTPSDSELKTAADNPNRGIGLGQWTFGRHINLVNYASEWYTIDTQLDFMTDGSSKGDGANVGCLKTYALNAGTDVRENAGEFQKVWERSTPDSVPDRKDAASSIWDYMKKNGMTGGADTSKINSLTGSGSGGGSASDSGSSESQLTECASTTNRDGVPGGDSVEMNGKSGKVLGSWDEAELPKQFKDSLSLVDYKAPDFNSSPFQGALAGQCTEFTWAYIQQLWTGKAQTIGNGGDLWKTYQSAGAKITSDPTLGYGMSAISGYAFASGDAGHTGIVVAVYKSGTYNGQGLKGAFLVEQFNGPIHPAPSRKPYYTLVDGTDGKGIHFFSGLGDPKSK